MSHARQLLSCHIQYNCWPDTYKTTVVLSHARQMLSFFMFGWPCIIFKYFVSFPTWYTYIFLFTFTILQFSLHVSDRLVHHQENQITRAASGTFPSFVAISCVAAGVTQLAPTAPHEIATNEGKVPEAARVIWFSWWWTSRVRNM